MICPYNVKRITHTEVTSKDYDDGIEKSTKVVFNQEKIFMECFKDACGVWYNGRCCYQVVQVND